eukprot:TRINITY_DN9911_c0_g1_i1.p1 TRINITY_DN9911_c0_g1~~TRINITY_DN9911_c0_g1_i1.p1  ORF type:complete len:532 (-),score=99.62 TRINITY_DN9911_c0_g1_i1:182-1777(-)
MVHVFTSDTLQGEIERFEQRMKDLQPDPEEANHKLRFNAVMGTVIVLNAISMGIEIDYGPHDATRNMDRMPWIVFESIFITVFIVELFVRMFWEGAGWRKLWWNWLDLFIVVCAVFETWILPSISGVLGDLSMLTLLRIVRLVRLVRIIRLVRMFRGLYAMAVAFQQALYSMMWICGIMAVGMYICGIFTTIAIGHNDELADVRIGDDTAVDRFGTLPRSIYSLFELMTLEGWQEVGRPLVMRMPVLFIFLFLYVVIFTFGLLNMIVAVVVEKTLLQARLIEETDQSIVKKEQLKQLENIITVIAESDENGDGVVSQEEFETILKRSAKVWHLLSDFGLPVTDAEAVWAVLDCEGTGSLTGEDLLAGCLKAQGCTNATWDVYLANAIVRGIQRQVDRLQAEVREVRAFQARAEEAAAAHLTASRADKEFVLMALHKIDAKLNQSMVMQEEQWRTIKEQSDEQAKVLRSLLDVTERLRTLEEQQRQLEHATSCVPSRNAMLQIAIDEELCASDVPESDVEEEEEKQSRAQLR